MLLKRGLQNIWVVDTKQMWCHLVILDIRICALQTWQKANIKNVGGVFCGCDNILAFWQSVIYMTSSMRNLHSIENKKSRWKSPINFKFFVRCQSSKHLQLLSHSLYHTFELFSLSTACWRHPPPSSSLPQPSSSSSSPLSLSSSSEPIFPTCSLNSGHFTWERKYC